MTTLAIGDGANDVNMINAAHIGVGISGLEGQQASRASDYSIGQFRFLRNLLLIHGREAYRRNSYLILYTFYKNVLYVMPIFYFGIVSGFSGTQIYDTYMYQLYNLAFTGMPICWFAVFDYEYEKPRLLTDLRLYSIGLEDKCFNPYKFWGWYFMAAVQGAILLFLTFQTLDETSGVTHVPITGEEITTSANLTLDGLFIFQAIVILVNAKLFIQSNIHTGLSVFWTFGCALSFYVFLLFMSESTWPF